MCIRDRYEGGTDDGTLRLLSGQGKEVLVVLPNDDAFLTEMQAYLTIERFLRKNTSVQLLSEGKSFADIKKLNEETNIYLSLIHI